MLNSRFLLWKRRIGIARLVLARWEFLLGEEEKGKLVGLMRSYERLYGLPPNRGTGHL